MFGILITTFCVSPASSAWLILCRDIRALTSSFQLALRELIDKTKKESHCPDQWRSHIAMFLSVAANPQLSSPVHSSRRPSFQRLLEPGLL